MENIFGVGPCWLGGLSSNIIIKIERAEGK